MFGAAGARTEMPGCSLCMGNQAQVREGATVVSTSTRNFPNRLGKNTNVYLASAELAAIASKLGRLPTVAEYHADMGVINKDASTVYRYMNFDQIEEYVDAARARRRLSGALTTRATRSQARRNAGGPFPCLPPARAVIAVASPALRMRKDLG